MTAPSAKPASGLLAGEERVVPEVVPQRRAVRLQRLSERVPDRADVWHVRVVDHERPRPAPAHPSQRYPSQSPQSAARPTSRSSTRAAPRGSARQPSPRRLDRDRGHRAMLTTLESAACRCSPAGPSTSFASSRSSPATRTARSGSPGRRPGSGRASGCAARSRNRGGGDGRRGGQPVVHARAAPPTRRVLIGGHIDSVPNGGWLDGCLNVVAGVEVLRRIAEEGTPPVTVRLVNWADEEGARFGRSLFGSSAAAGSMADQDELRARTDARRDRAARRAPRARRRPRLARSTRAASSQDAAAYLELHIEQGPVLESLDLPLGVVLGTFGVERHQVTFRGQAAHAGSTPMDKRRDALAGAARLELEIREIAKRTGGRRRLHDGRRRHEARHRHVGRRDRGVSPRPAPSRRREARRHARRGEARVGADSPATRTSRSSGSGSGTSSRSSSTTR